MNLNEDFQAYLAQRGQELAATKTDRQAAYERQERLTTQGSELFAGLFAQLDEDTAHTTQEPAPADPAENDFNNFFGIKD